MAEEPGEPTQQALATTSGPENPAKKAAAEEISIEVREGRVFLGEKHGWCGPDEFKAKIQRVYNMAAGLEKPAGGDEASRTVFSRLGLMLEFGMTKRQWNALAKLPGFSGACEMATTMAEAFMESLLLASVGRNPAGAIFALKNSHDWRDAPEVQDDDAALKLLAAVIHLPSKRPAQIAGE